MARYRRYRRTIIRAPKKKWCSNMRNLTLEVTNSDQSVGLDLSKEEVLAENKTETSSPTPVIIKTGNFKLQADFYLNYSGTQTANATRGQLYIIYVPQGILISTYSLAAAVVSNHPEWIMAWRYFDIQQGSVTLGTIADGGKISMTSRLKRNLNTGDQIYAVLLVNNLPPSSTIHVHGMCQFWSCAN